MCTELFECEICGEQVEEVTESELTAQLVCEACETSGVCDRCGELRPLEWVEYTDAAYCAKCLKRHTARCYRCRENILRSDISHIHRQEMIHGKLVAICKDC